MRLAQTKLKTNRLLYIRHPNNPQAINYHIYARVLESFAQKVSLDTTERTQLDLLLARSFTNILKLRSSIDNSSKLKRLIDNLEQDNLKLFDILGTEGSQRHRDNWKFIETKITQWWENKYSAGGYSPKILQGIIKFCMYKDNPLGGIKYKDQIRRWLAGNELDEEIAEKIGLSNWQSDLSTEEFAIASMTLFGQLSTLDEPLIIVFDQLESLLNNPPLLINFGDAIREILTHVPHSLIIVNLFPDRWQTFQQYFDTSTTDRLSQHIITLQRPSNSKLRQILSLKCQEVGMNLEQLFTNSELELILQETSIRKVINQAFHYLRHKFYHIPLPLKTLENDKKLNLQEENTFLKQRIAELEAIIRQIAGICTSILNQGNFQLATSLPPKVDEEVKDTNNHLTDKDKKAELLEYLDLTQKNIAAEYNNPHIINDDDDWGKLLEIVKVLPVYDPNIQIDQLNLGKRVLPNHLLLTTKYSQNVVGFLHASGNSFTSRIKNFNQLVNSYKHIKFCLLRDIRENPITGKMGKQEIERLNYAKNGQFVHMDKKQRVDFEVMYQMIIDINEGDIEIDLSTALNIFIPAYRHFWLIELLAI